MLKKMLLFLFVYIYFTQSLMAKLSVAPQFISFDKNSPKVQMINVINGSDKPQTFNAKLLHYKQNENGTYTEIKSEDKQNMFADDLIFFGPRRFTLNPQSSQVIKVQKKSVNGIKEGEYRSHLLFQEAEEEHIATAPDTSTSNGLSFKITALYGISIPVIVRIGDLFSTASLSNIKKQFINGKEVLNLDIHRSGTKSLRGDLIIKYENEELGILKGINVFLSVDKRNVSIPLNTEKIKTLNLKGKTLKIEYVNDGKVFASSFFKYL